MPRSLHVVSFLSDGLAGQTGMEQSSPVYGAAVKEALAPSVTKSVGAIVVAHPRCRCSRSGSRTHGRKVQKQGIHIHTDQCTHCTSRGCCTDCTPAYVRGNRIHRYLRTGDIRTVKARETFVANAEVVFAHARVESNLSGTTWGSTAINRLVLRSSTFHHIRSGFESKDPGWCSTSGSVFINVNAYGDPPSPVMSYSYPIVGRCC